MSVLDAGPQLGSATGGAFSTCDAIGANLDVSLVTGLGVSFGDQLPGFKAHISWPEQLTTSRARAVNNWALGQCFSAYRVYSAIEDSRRAEKVSDDTDFCSEISAFISATYYAYESGWYGADLLAVLGGELYILVSFFSPRTDEVSPVVDRVNRWNDVLAHLCRAPGCPANTCDTLTSHVSRHSCRGMLKRLMKSVERFLRCLHRCLCIRLRLRGKFGSIVDSRI